MNTTEELGRERYESGSDLRNPQLYPDEYVHGYQLALEAHQDRETESRWADGGTW